MKPAQFAVLALPVLLAAPATAQPFALDSFSVDAGGGTLNGTGVFMVTGSIGQPDAGVLEGDVYSLAGGFLARGVPVTGCSAADIALPLGVLDLDDVNTFIAGFLAGDTVADIAPPTNVLDLGDVDAFIHLFLQGCL